MARRYRRPGGGGAGSPRLLAVALVVAVLAMAAPAGSFTLGELSRASGSNVVDDIDGTLGLDVAASVQKKTIDRLVTVTNSLGVTVSVTVTVTNDNRHDLYLNGTNHGSQVTFTLADGASQQVDVEAHPSQNQVVFDVTATATSVDVIANGRSASVV